MALYLTGDTHGNFRRLLPEAFYEQETMTKENIVLVCGDFGGVWYGDKRDNDGLDFLERRPFTTAFVPGNHENYDALRTCPLEEWRGGTVRPIRPSVLMLERGQVFELGGKRIFAMGGASSHDIRDGILEPDDPLFQKKFKRLNAQGALFRVEGGAAQRGGVRGSQGQSGESRLGGGLHRHPLRSHQHSERPAPGTLRAGRPDGLPGGSQPTVQVQVPLLRTLPQQPGHPAKICPAVRADPAAKMRQVNWTG